MANLKNVIYLSNADYATLVSTGTVTINGTTLTYDPDNVYITPEEGETFNVINASDLVVSSGTGVNTVYSLTTDQYALFTNGKPTIIFGNIFGFTMENAIFSAGTVASSNRLFGTIEGTENATPSTTYRRYLISSTNTSSPHLQCGRELIRINNFSGNGYVSVYGKQLSDYPTTNTSPQVLTIGANGGNLIWGNNIPTNAYATNSTTQLEYETINNISVSANTTFTLAIAPSDTYPEYKANITNSGASDITITLPSGTIVKAESGINVSANTFVILADMTCVVSIQDNLALVIIKG